MADSKQVKEALKALADGDTARDVGTEKPTTGQLTDESPAIDRATPGTVSDQPTEYQAVIKRASKTTEDIEAAAVFVEEVGIAALEAAVADAEREVSGLAEDGREALAAFEQFRAAADGHGGKHRRG